MEIFDATYSQLSNTTAITYGFRRDLQGPLLEMGMRGIRVDIERRDEVLRDYRESEQRLSTQLRELFKEGFDLEVNPASPTQLKGFFYEFLEIKPFLKRNANNVYVPSVDREALEQLQNYFIAEPFSKHILAIRDLAKKIGVLETGIDADGRMRTSYNIAGTTTGRLSSSLSEFGFGTNLQNIEKKLRSVFIADEGCKLCEIDLEQAESRAVGAILWNLFGDSKYLDACESGDLHTSVAILAWSDLNWSSDLRQNKIIAEQPFYRQHSFRHMAKILGHGTNYNGKPPTMAKHTKLDQKVIKEFQARYFAAFPALQEWHRWTAKEIATSGRLTSLLGMQRDFWDRRDDASTVRAAIAFDPQSTVGELLNRGLLSVWRADICQLLLQVHDAIVFQYPEDMEDRVVSQALKLLEQPIELRNGRTLIIPAEAKTGYNWGPQSESNPRGLSKWAPRSSTEQSKSVG